MKRIICTVLSLLMLLGAFVACDTGDQPTPSAPNPDITEQQEEKPHVHTYQPATCAAPQTCSSCGETTGVKKDHDVEKGECSMCGMSYYDELQALIEKKGTANNAGTLVCEYRQGDYTIWINYEPQNDVLYFKCFEEEGSFFDGLMFYVDKASVKNQKYAWEFSVGSLTSDRAQISGELDATSFSSNTTALEYSNSTFSSVTNAGKQAQNAAKMLKETMKVFKTFLQQSEKEISAMHFGFEHYE